MKINWTDSAIEDLHDIKTYIAKNSVFYATRFIDKLITGVERLSTFPEIGRAVPEAQNKLVRELIYKPYRIIYIIKKDYVDIITIVNSHRDLTNSKLRKWEIR